MKERIALFLLLALASCSSGDLQIQTIDFESAPVEYCGTVSTNTQLFFKLNDQEALILQLAAGLLRNENSDGVIESNIPGASQLTYRIFKGDVGSGYFCDAIPPAEPSVLENLEAEAGKVRIATVQNASDTTKFEHTITLQGVSFVNSKGERLTDLSVENFGTITTTSN
jgi:hypothetical protein